MDREAYNNCLKPYISGKQSKSERSLNFCIGAKVCSGKVEIEAEARQLCSLPKEPKLPKIHKAKETAHDENCDVATFDDIISRFNKVYISVVSDDCTPCNEVKQAIRDASINYPIVEVPAYCDEIIDKLGVTVLPTVVRMEKGKVIARHLHTGKISDIIVMMQRGQ